LEGDEPVLATYAGLLDEFDPNFNIVTPEAEFEPPG
jgi:hypothetical protein